MAYKVLEYFQDMWDSNREYNVGDAYPREGLTVTDERIKELSTTANKRGVVLIAKEEAEEPAENTVVVNEPEKPRRRKRKTE